MKKRNGLIFASVLVVVFYVLACSMKLGEDSVLSAASFVYAGVFLAVIVLLLTGALADWVVVLGASSLMILTDAVFRKVGIMTEPVFTMPGLFGAFSGSTVWLVIMVFALSAGIGKSGLLNRIAIAILSVFPPSYTGAVVAMMCTGTVLSPLIPSVNAKVNILIPFATSTTEEMGIKPRSKGALGLFTACYLPAYLGGNAFLTGSVYVSVICGFITSYAAALGVEGASFNFVSWLVAASVWFVVLLAGTFLFCAVLCRPAEKVEFSRTFFKDRLKEMGAMRRDEKIAGAILVIALLLWSTSSFHGMDTAMIGWAAICVMCATGLLAPSDFNTKIPWSLVVFIGSLLGMANYMSTLGWSDAIAGVLGPILAPLVASPWIFVPFICIFTYLLRFLIIEQNTALVVVMAIFGGLMHAAGMNLYVIIFTEFMSSMCWTVPYMNPFAMATLGVAGGKYVTFPEMRRASILYMAINLVGCTASIPLWYALGFLH
ncbi:SLC13 family permease [Enterocloster asparagiformis]|uniref:SLC13 family permease n=1 Tax=Enterocloster asparagiformis TaxID=333367 RepID=UPI0004B090A3|nr:SLC13 family permease [Enterocloster asparagiformis]